MLAEVRRPTSLLALRSSSDFSLHSRRQALQPTLYRHFCVRLANSSRQRRLGNRMAIDPGGTDGMPLFGGQSAEQSVDIDCGRAGILETSRGEFLVKLLHQPIML